MQSERYAIVRDGVVREIEDCIRGGTKYPLSELVHQDLLPMFVPIPFEQKDKVCCGWRYDAESGRFTEPVIGSPIPSSNDIYVPKGQDQQVVALTLQAAQSSTQSELNQIEIQRDITELFMQ